jgi:hypothetical protein
MHPAGHDRRVGVVEMIARLGPRVKGSVPALRAVLAEPPITESPGDALRPAAAEALLLVEGQADDALAVLIMALAEPDNFGNDAHGSRQGRAAVALGRIGKPVISTVPALRVLLEKGRFRLDRLEAAVALWRLTGDVKPIPALLSEILKSKLEGDKPDKEAHARAIAVMAQMGARAKDAAAALADAIRAEDAVNARQSFSFRIQKNDEEDEDPNTADLIRRTGLPVLQQLEPTAAKTLAVPTMAP